MLVIGGGVIALAYFLAGAVVSGPPSYPDPLTGHWARAIPAGGIVTLAGWITGEDYVTGNFSVLTPPGALVGFAVYNASEFRALGQSPAGARATQTSPSTSGARIVFAAPYTDTFYFVWKNPYPAASGIGVAVYVSTEYRSNVVLG
jgi:hypothetical protein